MSCHGCTSLDNESTNEVFKLYAKEYSKHLNSVKTAVACNHAFRVPRTMLWAPQEEQDPARDFVEWDVIVAILGEMVAMLMAMSGTLLVARPMGKSFLQVLLEMATLLDEYCPVTAKALRSVLADLESKYSWLVIPEADTAWSVYWSCKDPQDQVDPFRSTVTQAVFLMVSRVLFFWRCRRTLLESNQAGS